MENDLYEHFAKLAAADERPISVYLRRLLRELVRTNGHASVLKVE